MMTDKNQQPAIDRSKGQSYVSAKDPTPLGIWWSQPSRTRNNTSRQQPHNHAQEQGPLAAISQSKQLQMVPEPTCPRGLATTSAEVIHTCCPNLVLAQVQVEPNLGQTLVHQGVVESHQAGTLPFQGA